MKKLIRFREFYLFLLKIIISLIGRYVRILEVSKEYKKNEKLNDYIKRYLEVKEVLSEMEFYFSLDFEDIEENEVLTELIKELKFS